MHEDWMLLEATYRQGELRALWRGGGKSPNTGSGLRFRAALAAALVALAMRLAPAGERPSGAQQPLSPAPT